MKRQSLIQQILRPNAWDAFNLLLLGFLIRIIIGTFTINWDFLRVTQLTARLASEPLLEIYKDPLSLYPVLTYYTRYAFLAAAKPFLTSGFWSQIGEGDLAFISSDQIFRTLFILKLPFIILELATAYLFSRLFARKKQNQVLFLWMINGIALYTIAAFTNVDVFPIFFIVLSVYFLRKNRLNSSAFILGIASAYKFFPILILPYLLFAQKKIKEKIRVLLFFILPFLGSQIAMLTTDEYWKNSLLAQANRIIFAAKLDIGHGRNLLLFIVIYLFLYYFFISDKTRNKKLESYFFLALTPVFLVSAFNLQWAYWVLPVILCFSVLFPNEKPVNFFLYFSYFAIVFLSQTSLNIGMLSPIEPALWTLDFKVGKFLGNETDFILNIFYSIFSASLAYISYKIIRKGNAFK